MLSVRRKKPSTEPEHKARHAHSLHGFKPDLPSHAQTPQAQDIFGVGTLCAYSRSPLLCSASLLVTFLSLTTLVTVPSLPSPLANICSTGRQPKCLINM